THCEVHLPIVREGRGLAEGSLVALLSKQPTDGTSDDLGVDEEKRFPFLEGGLVKHPSAERRQPVIR
ncbi:hypothetical protein NPIL_430341, partial [Nephila pilipes]